MRVRLRCCRVSDSALKGGDFGVAGAGLAQREPARNERAGFGSDEMERFRRGYNSFRLEEPQSKMLQMDIRHFRLQTMQNTMQNMQDYMYNVLLHMQKVRFEPHSARAPARRKGEASSIEKGLSGVFAATNRSDYAPIALAVTALVATK
jgi:hypothetical protein